MSLRPIMNGFSRSMVMFFVLAILISIASAYPGTWSYIGSAYKSNGEAVLTQNQNGQVGAIWLQEDVSGPFYAHFKYRAGGGSGADGLVFMFYKRIDNDPPGGGNLGFSPGNGYGIEFDSLAHQYDPQGKHVALIGDSVEKHLTYSYFNGVNDYMWHDVNVDATTNTMHVYIDGSEVLAWDGGFSYNYGGIGFSAATGGANDWHEISDVEITPYYEVGGTKGKGDSAGKNTKTTRPRQSITGP